MTLAPGTIVNDKYRIETLVGCGGQGDVYRALDTTLGRAAALKLLCVDRGVNPSDVRKRCEREAQALAKLNHPFIAAIHEVGQVASTGQPFLAMQYFEGQPLLTWGSLTPRSHITWLRIADKICDALSHAHARGIVHRDIKSTNVLVGGHPTNPDVCVIDWGIARDTSGDRLTRSGAVMGTIGSVDPAVIRGEASWSPQSDLYSLGALLYRAMLGRAHLDIPDGSPTEALWAIAAENRILSPRLANPLLPRSIAELLANLLDANPSRRPHSAELLRRSIRELVEPTANKGVIVRSTKRQEHAIVRVGRLLIGVSESDTFADKEWEEILQLVAQEVAERGPFTVSFNYSPSAGPSPEQRRKVKAMDDVLCSSALKRTALVTESAVVRGTLTALRWLFLNSTIRAFSPTHCHNAFQWLHEAEPFDLSEATSAFNSALAIVSPSANIL